MGIWCNMDDWNLECAKDLSVPKWVCIWPIFPREHHNSTPRTWPHEVLLTADIIGCVVHAKDLRLGDGIQVIDKMEVVAFKRTKLAFITVIVVLK